MNALNAIFHTQEAMATKLAAIKQTLRRILGVHGNFRQLTTPNSTYEMFSDYLITRLVLQLEERLKLR